MSIRKITLRQGLALLTLLAAVPAFCPDTAQAATTAGMRQATQQSGDLNTLLNAADAGMYTGSTNVPWATASLDAGASNLTNTANQLTSSYRTRFSFATVFLVGGVLLFAPLIGAVTVPAAAAAVGGLVAIGIGGKILRTGLQQRALVATLRAQITRVQGFVQRLRGGVPVAPQSQPAPAPQAAVVTSNAGFSVPRFAQTTAAPQVFIVWNNQIWMPAQGFGLSNADQSR